MRILFLLLAMVLVASFPFVSNFLSEKNPQSKQETEKIVAEYIEKNPQVIIDSVRVFEKNKADEYVKEKFESAFKENKDRVFDESYPMIKNAVSNAPVIVEFFDYACSYCKRMKSVIADAIENRNATVIFREMPILGEPSMMATKFSLAVNMLDSNKYLDFQAKLLEPESSYTYESLMAVAKNIGVDESALQQVLDDKAKEIEEKINDTYYLANELGIQGTPAFIINDKLHIGAFSIEDLDK